MFGVLVVAGIILVASRGVLRIRNDIRTEPQDRPKESDGVSKRFRHGSVTIRNSRTKKSPTEGRNLRWGGCPSHRATDLRHEPGHHRWHGSNLLDFSKFDVERCELSTVWVAPESDFNGFVAQVDNQTATLVLRVDCRTGTFEFHQVRLDKSQC